MHAANLNKLAQPCGVPPLFINDLMNDTHTVLHFPGLVNIRENNKLSLFQFLKRAFQQLIPTTHAQEFPGAIPGFSRQVNGSI